ncbi:MAG: FAD-dependent oxidoreductase [Deltaproteobacteria bacterium]|nr:FAD-dependent oxidoreductase [Deltaproteobacteria bacterium]
MKIAVVGTGIAGNVVAHLLAGGHELTVYEQDDRVGGHTNTVRVDAPDGPHAVDTGFIVFNEERYPNFVRLLRRLQVPSQPSSMSFSVHSEVDGLEYSNRSLFAQRRNALRPRFLRMIADIVRFNASARQLLLDADDSVLLGPFLRENHYSEAFVEHFLYPMGAAIWSADPLHMREFPARFFAQFFTNHRFLDVFGQPEWRVVRGGSHRYVEKLTANFRDRIRLSSPVVRIRRAADHVVVTSQGGGDERFDEVVVAAHGNQALALLADPTPQEREILGSFRFQENLAVLHTDTRLLPRRRRAWACWNACVPRNPTGRVALTYDMNLLQGLKSREEYLVTLNREADIDPAKVLRTIRYHHPVFSRAAVAAQRRHAEISGQNRTHFCGAYWGFGFHEDGVNSGLAVARRFGQEL